MLIIVFFMIYLSPELIRQTYLDFEGFIGFPTYFHVRMVDLLLENENIHFYDDLSFSGRNYTYPPALHILISIICLLTNIHPAHAGVLFAPFIGTLCIFVFYSIAKRLHFSSPALAAILFALTPTQMYNASHLSSRIFPLFLCLCTMYLAINHEKKRFFILTIPVLATIWITHPIVSLLTLIMLLPVFGFKEKKKLVILLFSSIALVGFWHIILVQTNGMFTTNILHKQFEDLFPHFLSYIFESGEKPYLSVSIVLLVYAILAIPRVAKKEKSNIAVEWFFIALLLTLLIGARANIYIPISLCLLATAFLKKEATQFSKHHLLYLLLFVVMVLEMLFIIRYMAYAQPHNDTFDALKFLQNNANESDVVMSAWNRGHWISYISNTKNVYDIYAEYAPRPAQTWFDTQIFYVTNNESIIYGILDKYNVTHLYFDRIMLRWEHPATNHTLLPILNNDSHFKKIYDKNETFIYTYESNKTVAYNMVPGKEGSSSKPWFYLLCLIPILVLGKSYGVPLSIVSLIAMSRIHILSLLSMPTGWEAFSLHRYASLIMSQGTMIPYDILSGGGRYLANIPGAPLIATVSSFILGQTVANSILWIGFIFSFALCGLIYLFARQYTRYAMLTPLIFIFSTNIINQTNNLNPLLFGLFFLPCFLYFSKKKELFVLLAFCMPLISIHATIALFFILLVYYKKDDPLLSVVFLLISGVIINTSATMFLGYILILSMFNLEKCVHHKKKAAGAIALYFVLKFITPYTGLWFMYPITVYLSLGIFLTLFFPYSLVLRGVLFSIIYSFMPVIWIILFTLYCLEDITNSLSRKYLVVAGCSFLLFYGYAHFYGVHWNTFSWGYSLNISSLPHVFGNIPFYLGILALILYQNKLLYSLFIIPLFLSQHNTMYYLSNKMVVFIIISLSILATISIEQIVTYFKKRTDKKMRKRIFAYASVFLIYWLLIPSINHISHLRPYIGPSQLPSIKWLEQHSEKNDTIVSNIDISSVWIPEILGRKTLADGNFISMPHLGRRMWLIKEATKLNCWTIPEILWNESVDFVYLSEIDANYHNMDLYTANKKGIRCMDLEFYNKTDPHAVIFRKKGEIPMNQYLDVTYALSVRVSEIISASQELVQKHNATVIDNVTLEKELTVLSKEMLNIYKSAWDVQLHPPKNLLALNYAFRNLMSDFDDLEYLLRRWGQSLEEKTKEEKYQGLLESKLHKMSKDYKLFLEVHKKMI